MHEEMHDLHANEGHQRPYLATVRMVPFMMRMKQTWIIYLHPSRLSYFPCRAIAELSSLSETILYLGISHGTIMSCYLDAYCILYKVSQSHTWTNRIYIILLKSLLRLLLDLIAT